MAKYKLMPAIGTRESVYDQDEAMVIPNYPNHPPWLEYLAWLASGNTPDPVINPPATVAEAMERKLTALAYYRWQKETEGITLNGVGIKTDRESQGLLNGALKLFDLNPLLAAIDWKGENGWVQVDKATREAVGLAVGAHVQACFSREKAHATAIEALTAIDDIEAYDITTGWPE